MTPHLPNSQAEIRNRNSRSPLTESPWFWVLAFSLMALVALVAMSGKYGRRQAGIERQYQARDRAAAQVVDQSSDSRSADQRAYASSSGTLVPLWPLAALMAVAALLAAVMVYRNRRGSPDGEESPS